MLPARTSRLRQLMRGMFWILCVLVALAALIPPALPARLPALTSLNDKAQHLLAFFLLALIGIIAYRTHRALILMGLLGLGIGIEFAQGLSLIGRDREWLDVIADAAGLLLSIAAVAAWRLASTLR